MADREKRDVADCKKGGAAKKNIWGGGKVWFVGGRDCWGEKVADRPLISLKRGEWGLGLEVVRPTAEEKGEQWDGWRGGVFLEGISPPYNRGGGGVPSPGRGIKAQGMV